MSEEYYKVIDDIFNPKRKEYKHEFYCLYCAEYGFFKKQSTSRLWASCPNCHDGSMHYLDSNSKLWGDDEKIKEYLHFINKLTQAQSKYKEDNFCDGCYGILLNEKYEELSPSTKESYGRNCYADILDNWKDVKCNRPNKDTIELISIKENK
tara:strand:- start:95 stop:550 length:456 start_codon:yes stop_codon:yes gene_type:complete